MENNERLGTDRIIKLLVSMSIPAIAAQLVNVLYNIVDRIFIARIPEIGTTALTGVGIAFPILMIISAFSSFIGMGGAPLASIRLGRKEQEQAERILGNAFILLTILSLVITVVFFVWKVDILYLFGASESNIGYAVDYIGIYLIGTIFVQYALGLNSFINAQGFAKFSMLTVMIGAGCNLLLDPLLIFVFQMGVKGAALATIVSQGISAIWVLSFLFGKKTMLRIRPQNFELDGKLVGSILALGISPFIMQSTESIVSIVFNRQLGHYGGDLYVAAMVILNSMMQFVMLPLMGLTQGSQPIIGYNYGAKRYERVKSIIKITFLTATGYVCLMWFLCQLIPNVVASLFSNDTELIKITAKVMKIYFFGIFAFGAQIVFQNAFIALGQAKISMFLALLRKVVFLIPLLYLIPAIMGNGVNDVFLAQPVADIAAAACTTIAFILISKKIFPYSRLDKLH